jgi:hypothetical protein
VRGFRAARRPIAPPPPPPPSPSTAPPQFLPSQTIEPAQFNAWLVQDYLFVRGFTRFAASVLVSAPEVVF